MEITEVSLKEFKQIYEAEYHEALSTYAPRAIDDLTGNNQQ